MRIHRKEGELNILIEGCGPRISFRVEILFEIIRKKEQRNTRTVETKS